MSGAPSSDPTPTPGVEEIPRPRILVVDDTPANLVAMRRLLSRCGADLVEAQSGNAALAACLEHDFAVVLLDVQMPDIDGLEVAKLLSEDPQTRDIPIILVTAAAADDLQRLRGYHFGAVDYIAKPVDDMILRAKVNVFLDLYRGRMQMQQLLAMLNERNRALEIEIAERKRAEARVRHQATHDALTGLPNRALFMERAEQALLEAVGAGRHCALLYVDIDGFKPVNDQHGHHAGDLLLMQIAGRMVHCVGETHLVARIGGDEFAVVVPDAPTRDPLVRLADALRHVLQQPFELELGAARQARVNVGASIGIARSTHAIGSLDPLEAVIRAADTAMYEAKRSGRNAIVLAPE